MSSRTNIDIICRVNSQTMDELLFLSSFDAVVLDLKLLMLGVYHLVSCCSCGLSHDIVYGVSLSGGTYVMYKTKGYILHAP